MGLISAGHLAGLARYIGYMKPYATSHDDLIKTRRCRTKCSTPRLRLQKPSADAARRTQTAGREFAGAATEVSLQQVYTAVCPD